MAQSFVKLADQIMLWVNQLMGLSFALFLICNKGPLGNLRISLWETKKMHSWMLLGWLLGCQNLSY